jgi:NAD(P)-dependent dehydrogenase (short-subunit alcohol dehydrogenase family)
VSSQSRVAVVTGASAGIGAAIVRELARKGAAVAFSARGAETVEQLTAEIVAAGGQARGIVADMASDVETESFLERVLAELGPIDILVNNVGSSPSRNFQRMTDEQWLALVNLNLMAAVRCTRAVLPGMRERHWGRIIMISSLAAKHPDAALVDYAATKAALLATAKALARRYGRDGVLVNSVLPGLILTPMWERAAAEIAAAREQSTETVIAEMGARVPVGRYGTADEVASVVGFLASEEASYVNGAAIDVDGGLSSHVF